MITIHLVETSSPDGANEKNHFKKETLTYIVENGEKRQEEDI